MRKRPVKKKVPLPKPEEVLKPKIKPTDCFECVHGKPWKYGLIDCETAITAAVNCMERKIECARFKRK